MNKALSKPMRNFGSVITKVPEITIFFWIVKLLTTAMGETTSDYLVYHINPFLAVGMGFVALVLSFILQFSVKRYIAWVYWLAAAMVSVFGTMVADAIHIVLGVPYYISTITFVILLAVVFMVWYRVEKTLSIHSIYTRRREVFYWATVLVTFALGTAAGDMTAVTFHLGYLASGIYFTIVMFIPLIGYRWFKLNGIFAFWFAYIFTRPVGASYADWLSVPRSAGGLNVGKGPVSIYLTILIVILVIFLTITRKDVQDEPSRLSRREVPEI